MERKRRFPFGYEMREGRIVQNPEEAKAVAVIFQSFASGATTPTIANASIYEGKFKALKEEKQALQSELESLQRTSQMDAEAQNRIQKVWDCIQNTPTDFTQYDDDLVRRIAEQVIVYSKEKVVVKFVGGYSVKMQV